MFSDTAILVINLASIMTLVILLAIMVGATKMKGGAGWAALIIVTTTVPAYLTNLTQDFDTQYFLFSYFLAITLNVICMPAMWFFTRRQFDNTFRFRWRDCLHLIPAIVSLAVHIIYFAPLSVAEIDAEKVFIFDGSRNNLPLRINDVLIFAQFFIYYPVIFFYIRRRKKYLRDNYSDSDYVETKWTSSFLVVSFVLFFVVFLVAMTAPRIDAWLIPLLNIVAMGYLAYVVVKHSTADYLNRLSETAAAPEKESAASPVMDEAQMKEISDRVMEYLQTSKAYTNPELSVNMLSVETGIHSRNISIAINGYLHKNFFDLVSEMRIEEAKRLLKGLGPQYTADSVFPDCGFRSRSAFYASFKKYERVSPDRWRRDNA
jgi:AraC-like DNA-binding protein